MRLIKLSQDTFESMDAVREFFDGELRGRCPEGKFRFTEGRIAEDGLRPGEQVLFSYKSVVRYIASADSGRALNRDEVRDAYPYFFLVNMEALRPTEFGLADFETSLVERAGHCGCLVHSQGWPIIEDSDEVQVILEEFLSRGRRR